MCSSKWCACVYITVLHGLLLLITCADLYTLVVRYHMRRWVTRGPSLRRVKQLLLRREMKL
jgi:hypothetical protein